MTWYRKHRANRELFPNVITGNGGRRRQAQKGINFELLKQELQDYVVDGEEHYEFTGWKIGNCRKQYEDLQDLRPCIEESKD